MLRATAFSCEHDLAALMFAGLTRKQPNPRYVQTTENRQPPQLGVHSASPSSCHCKYIRNHPTIMAAILAPVPRPIGVFPQFFATAPEAIVLKEKVLSLTGDSFSIKLAKGTPILQVQGKLLSMSGRKKVSDMAGVHLFSIVKEHLHLHKTFAVENPSGQKIMEVKSSFQLIGSKATATFTSQNGSQETLTMRGNWLDTTADIVDEAQGGVVVARINRKLLSGRDVLFGQQTYGVEIAPGVDMALMAALAICLDESQNDK